MKILGRNQFTSDIPGDVDLLKDIQIKYPLVSADTIQSVYDIIRYPKVVDDLVRLAFP